MCWKQLARIAAVVFASFVLWPVAAYAHAQFATSNEAQLAAEAAKAKVESAQRCMDRTKERNRDNNAENLKEIEKLLGLYHEKAKVLSELRRGLFCSQCGQTSAEIESDGKTTFAEHLRVVRGVPVPAPEEVVIAKAAAFDDKIADQRARIARFHEKHSELLREYLSCGSDWSAALLQQRKAEHAARLLEFQEGWAARREEMRVDSERRLEQWRAEQERKEAMREQARLERERAAENERQAARARYAAAQARLRNLEEAARRGGSEPVPAAGDSPEPDSVFRDQVNAVLQWTRQGESSQPEPAETGEALLLEDSDSDQGTRAGGGAWSGARETIGRYLDGTTRETSSSDRTEDETSPVPTVSWRERLADTLLGRDARTPSAGAETPDAVDNRYEEVWDAARDVPRPSSQPIVNIRRILIYELRLQNRFWKYFDAATQDWFARE